MARNGSSALAALAAQVGNAATAGFGLSLGRDVYRKVRPKNTSNVVLLLLAVGGVFLPVLGGINLCQGHRRGWVGTIFLTFGVSVLSVAAGFCIMLSPFVILVEGFNIDIKIVGWILVITTGLTVLGMLIGLFRRAKRLRRFAIINDNEAFLARSGFKETGGSDVTHYDPNGNALRFLEADPDRLIFMAVGRRGRRAYIDLDSSGRMLAYSGIV
jgi:hypothetical protein